MSTQIRIHDDAAAHLDDTDVNKTAYVSALVRQRRRQVFEAVTHLIGKGWDVESAKLAAGKLQGMTSIDLPAPHAMTVLAGWPHGAEMLEPDEAAALAIVALEVEAGSEWWLKLWEALT